MKKNLFLFYFFLLFTSLVFSQTITAITRDKHHRESCSYLKQCSLPTSLNYTIAIIFNKTFITEG